LEGSRVSGHDLKSIRAAIINLIGRPDDSSPTGHDTWGEVDKEGKWSIRAYTNDNRFWVVFEAGPKKEDAAATAAK